MFLIDYYAGATLIGRLVYVEGGEGPRALGGDSGGFATTTVVVTDEGEWSLSGDVHPDEILPLVGRIRQVTPQEGRTWGVEDFS